MTRLSSIVCGILLAAVMSVPVLLWLAWLAGAV